jgi:hypothetical protein
VTIPWNEGIIQFRIIVFDGSFLATVHTKSWKRKNVSNLKKISNNYWPHRINFLGVGVAGGGVGLRRKAFFGGVMIL